MAIRLNRYLSESGFCSRREADGIIAAGIVTVNGEQGEFNTKVSPGDVVAIEGERVMPRRAIDFTPKEAPKVHKKSLRTAAPRREDKLPEWLKKEREEKPDRTPARASQQSSATKEKPKPKPKPKSKPSVNSKKYTPKKKFNV